MNVSLTPELDEFVLSKVKSGRYNSASEVVREALRHMQDLEQVKQIELEALRVKIAEGLDDLNAGRAMSMSVEEINARVQERGRRRISPQSGT